MLETSALLGIFPPLSPWHSRECTFWGSSILFASNELSRSGFGKGSNPEGQHRTTSKSRVALDLRLGQEPTKIQRFSRCRGGVLPRCSPLYSNLTDIRLQLMDYGGYGIYGGILPSTLPSTLPSRSRARITRSIRAMEDEIMIESTVMTYSRASEDAP